MSDTSNTQPPSQTFVKELIARAVHAPSGDNSQPWQFSFDGDAVILSNLPNADETLYNFRQRGSYLAHGAVIENMSLIAGESGYDLDVQLFPQIPGATAKILFVPGIKKTSPLTPKIEERATNRKPYKLTPFKSEHKEKLEETFVNNNKVQLKFIQQREVIDALAKTVSLNEQLLMENRPLHDFLFSIIRWSEGEERNLPGLYLKTMELPPPVQIMFRYVLRHWGAVQALNHIGLSRFIPKQSAPVYAASSAFGAIIVSGNTNEDFVAAGRAFQKMWLTATAEGMSIQPTTALPYLMQRIVAGEASAFTPEHQTLISEAYGNISHAFGLKGSEHIAMLFRIGYGDAPTAVSLKTRLPFVDPS